MPGINFNDLPKNLQQKLQPYRFVAKSVEDAIVMAKKAGAWTAADDKAFSALNGNKAWGQFDGFEKSSAQQVHEDLAQGVKEDPLRPFASATKKAIARDVAKNPKKYLPKTFKAPSGSGRYVVYQKDQNTGKDTYKYYAANGKQITAKAFNEAEKLSSVRYDEKAGKLAMTPKAKEQSGWDIALAIATLPITIFASCSPDDHEETIPVAPVTFNNYINITFDNASLTAAMQESNALQAKIVELLSKINNNTSLTNEEIAALKEEIKKLQQQLDTINKNVLNVIVNQENFAKSADEYYKQIIDITKGNQDLLKYIVEQLAESNSTLKQIKELMEKNNASLEQILEAITKCKYGIDKLHEDNEDIKKLLTTIATLISKLPNELKAKFSDYFNAIITGIADNGAKLDALTNMLQVINNSVNSGHTAILNKMEKMQAILDALFAKFDNFDAKVTNMLNSIATAIANMADKNVDLDKIEKTLNAILDKIGNDKAQMEQLTKLLQAINANIITNGQVQIDILEAVKQNKVSMDEMLKLLQAINANTVINGQTQVEILEAIKKLNGDMVAQFTSLIEIGNKNNALQEKSNKLIQEVLDAIKNLKIEPGSQTEVDLSKLIDCINNNGADLAMRLNEIYMLLTTINGNVVQGNEDNRIVLCKILEALSNKTDSPDFSKILEKLDAILKAIKDHNVKITVDGHITCDCNCGDGGTHEGVVDDLDWILG